MADAIQDLQNLADDSTLQNQVDIVDADEHNTHRTNYRTQINLQKTVAEEQDNNYASSTEPTLKSEGKIWADTTSDPALIKYYQDGSSNLQELVGTTLTQTLTNKTITSPNFTNGANGNVQLARDTKIQVFSNITNPLFQIDVSYEYLTLYSDNGLAYIRSQTTPITLDVSVTGAGGRAVSENAGSEQSDAWYYVYIYDDGQGVSNGLLSLQSSWDNVAAPDKPSGSDYVRRIGAIRNDSSSDLVPVYQNQDILGTSLDVGIQTTSTSPVEVNIDSFCPPDITKSVIGSAGITGGGGQYSIQPSSSSSDPSGRFFSERGGPDFFWNQFEVQTNSNGTVYHYVSTNEGRARIFGCRIFL